MSWPGWPRDELSTADAARIGRLRPTIGSESCENRTMDESMSEPTRTPPFAPFEWLLSGRYLRGTSQGRFLSLSSPAFSFLGIMLGVADADHRDGRHERLPQGIAWTRILGLNGHLLVPGRWKIAAETDWKDVAERISQSGGIRLAAPVVDGQALASSPFNAGRRSRSRQFAPRIFNNLDLDRQEYQNRARSRGSTKGRASPIGRRLADQLSLHGRRQRSTLVAPKGVAVTPMGHDARRASSRNKISAVFEIGMTEI